jgi:hypothetical protein
MKKCIICNTPLVKLGDIWWKCHEECERRISIRNWRAYSKDVADKANRNMEILLGAEE